MGSYKSKPKRRFVGFDNDWERRKFGDVGSVSMCKRIFKDETTDDGDIPFFKIGTFGGEPDAYISRNYFENYKAKYPYPNKGDILLSASGTIGRMVEYNGEEAYFQDSNIVWLSHDQSIDNSFLRVLYGIVKWDGIEGSTIQRLYNDNFLKTKFLMPTKDEQKKIGAYFANLDNLITLYQRKAEKLNCLKKAYLSEMFPAPGEKVPRRRFAGFAGAWVQRKYADVIELISGQDFEPSGYNDSGEGTPYMTGASCIENGGTIANRWTLTPKCIAKKDDTLLVCKGSGCGALARLTQGEAHIARQFMALRVTETLDNKFNYYLAATLVPEIQKDARGLIAGIARDAIMNQKVSIPNSKDEQKKIGEHLSNLDNLITLHQRKLAKLQALKKAYLAEMFV